MARKLVEDAKKIEAEHADSAKRRLAGSIGYLLAMEQAFDHDTRRLFELVRPYAQAVLADRQNETKFDEFQLFARAFIRALFAHVEGVTHLLRQVVLWAYERGEIGLDASHLSRLREPMPHAKEGLLLAFEQFPKPFRSQFALDKKSNGWNCFCRSIDVRNAMTHPKAVTDFKVSGDAILEAQLAAVWFNDSFRSLLLSCSDDAPKVDSPTQ